MKSPSSIATAEPLADLCAAHLAGQIASMERALASQRRAGASLIDADPGALSSVLHEAQSAAAVFEAAKAEQTEFRAQAAQLLHEPVETLTVGKIIESLPPAQSAALQGQRARLRSLMADVERANQANAQIMWWRLDFINQVFAGLPGMASAGRYGQEGRLKMSACGLLLQGNG